jgi:HK97 family phage prohead protease
MEKTKREIRMAELRIATIPNSEEMIVEGYAAVYEQPTVLWEYDGVQYKEVIARGAFDGADLKDVPFKYNHSDNVMIMARTRNKTLILTVDDKGLAIQANLANTTQSRDLYELIKRGDIDKMSFAFEVQTDEYDRLTHTRTIKKFKKLYDVAAVDLPAYDQTSISARSFFELEREKEQSLEREIELKRKQLIIKTYF